jgi:hypothetical protein
MHFFGFVFIITTTLIMLFKKESDFNEKDSTETIENESVESQLSIFSTYKLMWKLSWLTPVKQLVIILLTYNVR